MSSPVLALDLGGTHVSAGRVDVEHARVEEWVRIPLASEASREELLDAILRAARDVGDETEAVGVAAPGPFDYARGVSWLGHKLQALHGVDLRETLADGLGLEGSAISFVNDADAFLLGEWRAGAAKGKHRVVGVTLGTGLGSAFLEEGEIVDAGSRVPPGGEIHRVEYRGRPVEETVSRAALIERYSDSGADVHEIARRARAGDDTAARVFSDYGRALGEVFAPWLESFGATCLVVGGAIAAAWDLFAPSLRSALAELPSLETIEPGSLLDHAALIGAAYDARAGAARRRPAPRPVHELTVAEARAQQAGEHVDVDVDDGYALETLELDGPVPIRLLRPRVSEPLPVCVWFPGGGWVLDTLAVSEPACRRLAAETPCAVALVRYRLAPEHPFPAPLEDCLAATRWLLEAAGGLGLDPTRVAIGGTSAGGNLAAAVALRSRAEPVIPPAAQILVYPALEAGATADVHGSAFSRRDADWCWSHYLRTPSDGRSPLASPLLAGELDGLPPTLLVTAGVDPLREEAEVYAARLCEAGVSTELVSYAGAEHGFFSQTRTVDARAAQLVVVESLRRAFGIPDSSR